MRAIQNLDFEEESAKEQKAIQEEMQQSNIPAPVKTSNKKDTSEADYNKFVF